MISLKKLSISNQIKKHFPTVLVVIFFMVLLVGVRNQSQSWYFQDETEHITLGWMMTEYGKDLYTDLSTNHQPIPIFFSYFVKLISYQTLFDLVVKIRIFMWLFAFISSIFLSLRFKYKGALATIITYSLGHYFFSWHVIAESIVIPAVLFLLLFSSKIIQSKIEENNTFEYLIGGFSIFVINFSLLVLWPFTLLTVLLLIFKNKKRLIPLLIGAFIPTLILFLFISPIDWYQETIINIVKYFIPFYSESDPLHYVKVILYPFFHLSSLDLVVGRFYTFISFIFIAFVFTLKKELLSNFNFTKVLLLIGLVISLNPRTSNIGGMYYVGFHLFPYIAGLAFLIASILNYLLKKYIKDKKIIYLVVLFTTVGLLLINNLVWVFEQQNKLEDYYIKYNVFQSYGSAIKTISSDKDTLMTGPDGSGYMNMMAELPISGKQNFHLEWAYRVPYLRDYWINVMDNTPPTFIYFNLNNNSHSKYLKPILETKYINLKRSGETYSQLYILKESAKDVSSEQWADFENQGFEVPNLIQ